MKADFTRNTFDAAKHYTRVLMQQGRVQLDADWNEQAAILLHYLQALAADLIGPYGGPTDNWGFAITDAGTTPADLAINEGRYYVDGILCENKPWQDSTGTSHLPTYFTQPDYPRDPKENSLSEGKNYLIYLDVWERLITAYEDGHIREVALGGPDTAARAKVVWQVKTQATPPEVDLTTPIKCREWVKENWRNLVDKEWQPSDRGLLKAKAKEDVAQDMDACAVPPESRYRGTENQLYRVEIHQASHALRVDDKDIEFPPTFKWSRENGSVIFPIRKLAGGMAYLDHLGRDDRFGLKVGDWVEIVDDAIALHVEPNTPGPLVQIEAIDPLDCTVTLKRPTYLTTLPQYDDRATNHPLLRRWDHHPDKPDNTYGAIEIIEGDSGKKDTDIWLPLEDGIYIQFQKSAEVRYRTGDYWLISARTATGDVEWPHETDADGHLKIVDGQPVPADLPPHGIEHHYAPLAVVVGPAINDVRHKFAPVP